MSCTSIMTKTPLTISEDETVAGAAAMLIELGATGLPVVDSAGRYVGMFGISDLLGLLAPRIALAGDLSSNLRFLSDDPEELRRRYQEVKCRCVSEVADRNGVRLNPDASESEAIRLSCRSLLPIPVLEKETDRLIGVISCWDAIRAVCGGMQRT